YALRLVGSLYDRRTRWPDGAPTWRLSPEPASTRRPGAEARRELGLAGTSPPPSRWSVRTLRASLADYSRQRALAPAATPPPAAASVAQPPLQHRSRRRRQGRPLERRLREAVRWPQEVVLLFLDEMGYYRWPEGQSWRMN